MYSEYLLPQTLGEPLDEVQDAASLSSERIELVFDVKDDGTDSIQFCISTLPMWPVALDRSNRFGVSLDGGKPVVCENVFEEWSFPWKLQVMENRKDYLMAFPIYRSKKRHTLSLIIGAG